LHICDLIHKILMIPSFLLFFRWLTISVDKIIVLIILAALTVKFVFLEGRNESEQSISEMIANRRQVSDQETNTFDLETKQQNIPPITEIDLIHKETQTEQSIEDILTTAEDVTLETSVAVINPSKTPRSVEECICIMNSDEGAASLTDPEITMLVKAGGGHCPLYKIESILGDPERGVKIRREFLALEAKLAPEILDNLPYKHYDYTKVMNACCENVLGYVQIPVGYAGPLLLDGVKYFVPMATTEGALVASTNRGCKAISVRGVKSVVEDIGMTRAPCIKFDSIQRAAEVKAWIEHPKYYAEIKSAFDSTSRFARLKEIMIGMDGPSLYLRFSASTGDAMGMNMVSKGAEMALTVLRQKFPDMEIISLSGNFCSDKKPAAINWIKGRGKKVVCEAVIPADKLRSILKTDARTLVRCNKLKNMTGSAMAGSIGGNNAHAANMVTAVFIATGQDPAQNVTSSNCSTNMECCGENEEDLYMTCTMPSMEVGTVGGGTVLPGQGACLEMLGVKGAHITHPATNSKKLATVICATVMAGELSLMAALVNSDLVKSHMRHNR
jgi:hydroxymethylglutaryl-CoA reductase (NADPH)